MSSDDASDIFASDNEIMSDLELSQPAPPVDFGSSTEYLTGEVHRMAKVVARFAQGQGGNNGSSLSFDNQLLALQKGQQEILNILRAGTVSSTVNSVSVQTESVSTPIRRVVEIESSGSNELAITV